MTRISDTYDYVAEGGELLYQNVRFVPKAFKQRRPDPAGGWIWDMRGVRRVLFRLPELRAADPATPIVYCEGEKDVIALERAGFMATCNSNGTGIGTTEFSPLRDRRVFVIPDDDDAGRRHARHVAKRAIEAGGRVSIVTLPAVEGFAAKDPAEYFERGGRSDVLKDVLTDARILTADDVTEPDESGGALWRTFADIAATPLYRDGLAVVSTTFPALDNILAGGFRVCCAYVVGARTGGAKSTFLLNIGRRAALAGEPVLILRLEEGVVEAAWRIHAAQAEVPVRVLLDAAIPMDESDPTRIALRRAWDDLRGAPLRLSGERNLTAIATAIQKHAEAGGRLVLIDQASMVDNGFDASPFETMTATSNTLRELAIDHRVAIATAFQVNRPAAKKNNERLSEHDLRDSGAVENDASAVILIDRWRDDADRRGRIIELIVAKNRYGKTLRCTDPGDSPVELWWEPSSGRIDEIPVQWGASPA